MAVSEALDQINKASKLRKILVESIYKISHHTGLKPIKEENLDGSTYDIIYTVALYQHCTNVKKIEFDYKPLSEWTVEELSNEILNSFMILYHNLVVNKKHFNWNY